MLVFDNVVLAFDSISF